MVGCWSHIAIEPQSRERAELLSAIEADEDLWYDTEHDGEIVCGTSRGHWYAEEFLESIPEYVERATVVWETDEGPEVIGEYYEHSDGDVVLKATTAGTSKAAVTDFFARDQGINGAF